MGALGALGALGGKWRRTATECSGLARVTRVVVSGAPITVEEQHGHPVGTSFSYSRRPRRVPSQSRAAPGGSWGRPNPWFGRLECTGFRLLGQLNESTGRSGSSITQTPFPPGPPSLGALRAEGPSGSPASTNTLQGPSNRSINRSLLTQLSVSIPSLVPVIAAALPRTTGNPPQA